MTMCPLLDREGEEILERLLPTHPSEEILHNIDPRKHQALQKYKHLPLTNPHSLNKELIYC